MARAMGTTKKKSMTTTSQAETDAKEEFLCYCCGEKKKKTLFYTSTDPFNGVGITPFCKLCIEKIARNYNERSGIYGEVTKTSLCEALERIDSPYLESVWESSYNEVHNPDLKKPKTNIWSAYIKNVRMPHHNGLRWRDGDIFKNNAGVEFEERQKRITEAQEHDETYKKNRKAVIDFIGYDPYKDYPIEEDLPILYAKMLTFLDDETKNDGMKLNAVIQICKSFNQAEKVNASIDSLSANPRSIIDNAALIKNLQDAVAKAVSSAGSLAKDNGISVNFNNNKSKGANTLSGKMKELVAIGLREAKINTYDIGTCEGMRQVALINEECRHKQIGYDENIAQEIKDIKVELVETLTRERDEAVEAARRLLLENKDLKDFLMAKNLVNENFEVIDDE